MNVFKLSSLASVICCLVCSNLYALEPEKHAPNFSLSGVNGKLQSLSEHKGKVVLIDFWASWCGPCKKSLPWLSKLKTELASEDFQILAINLDNDHEDATKFLESLKIDLNVLFDSEGQTPQLFEVKTMPSSFLVDRDGIVKEVFEGFHESEKDKIKDVIKSLLLKGDK